MGMGRKACVDMVGCGGPFNKETDDHFDPEHYEEGLTRLC